MVAEPGCEGDCIGVVSSRGDSGAQLRLQSKRRVEGGGTEIWVMGKERR